jgi:hypothetical protein
VLPAGQVHENKRHEDLGIGIALTTGANLHVILNAPSETQNVTQLQVGRKARQRGHPALRKLLVKLER